MPSNDDLVQVLRLVSSAAGALGLRWLLVGAAARDLVLANLGLERLPRATIDVDIAVRVRTWREFDLLKHALIEREGFEDHSFPHRLVSPAGQPLDIVPFGKIAADGELVWQGSDGAAMDVALFDDALVNSTTFDLGSLTIRIPSFASLVSMKLSAWRDRHDDTRRDATDLVGLLERATEWPGLDSLYDEHSESLERYDFDSDLACIHLLGVRIARELSDNNRADIQVIVEAALDETAPSMLLRDLRGLARPAEFLLALLLGIRATR